MNPGSDTSALCLRVVLAVGALANTLETFDDLGVRLPPAAQRHAEGCLKIMGPAAVFTSILQAAPGIATSDRVATFVDVFVDAALRRRDGLLRSLPDDLRAQVAAHEIGRSVPPERVLSFFSDALADSRLPATLKRAQAGGDMAEAWARVQAAQGRVTPQGSGFAARDDEVQRAGAALPSGALAAVGDALRGLGLDEDALARVLDGVLPPDAPPGYADDGAGTLRRDASKIGRNDACPCGSGRKFKRCHGGA